jgi:hypothetical protein
MDLEEFAQVSSIIIASCAVIGLLSACLHMRIHHRIMEIDLFGHKCVVVKQYSNEEESGAT